VARRDTDTANRIWEANDDGGGLPKIQSYGEAVEAMPVTGFDLALPLGDAGGDPETYLPVLTAPEKPRILYDNPYGKILNVIPAQSPTYGLMLLDLIYANPDLYNRFKDEQILFGDYGHGPDEYGSNAITYDSSPTRGSGLYTSEEQRENDVITHTFSEHYHFTLYDCVLQDAMDPQHFMRTFPGMPDDTGYAPMPWDGFTFDPAPVEETYTKVYERFWGWYWEYGDSFRKHNADDALLPYAFLGYRHEVDLLDICKRLSDYGMDVILEECRRQYAEFLQNKGWTAPAPSN